MTSLPQARDAREERILAELRAVRGDVDQLQPARTLAAIAIGAASTRIVHGLGRIPTAWWCSRLRGDARVWEAAAPDSTALYLQASAPVTTDLQVL